MRGRWRSTVSAVFPVRGGGLVVGSLLVAFASACGSAGAGEHDVLVRVEEKAALADVPRIGVNLGHATAWGAEQLFANVVRNPGFEGIIDRTIVIVKRADASGFADDSPWLGRDDGFWAGAGYDVRSGRSAGRRGSLVTSRRAGVDGLPAFATAGEAPRLEPGDVVALTRIDAAQGVEKWWIPDPSLDLVSTQTSDGRPGTPGVRTLVLAPRAGRPTEIHSYLDAIGDRAGKLLPVEGRWRLSFWSRAVEQGARLHVGFQRLGAEPFVARHLEPGRAWTRTVIEFEARDVGPPERLDLRFEARGDEGRILLDDVDLRRVSDGEGEFRAEVIAALRELRPGYLRDWQGQLGDTLENRLAVPFARRPSRWGPGGTGAAQFGYSLGAFLGLCRRVGSRPWIVVPPVLSDAELVELGRFLAAGQASGGFAEVVVEFGNENWNPIFRAGGIPGPRQHGQVAGRAFARIREGAGPADWLRTVVNGQYANPSAALSFLDNAGSTDVLAVAPYFMYSLAAGTPPERWLPELMRSDAVGLGKLAAAVRERGRELAVYEVNLHTTGGDAPARERDAVTTGAAAGTALARRLLEGLAVGVRRQCTYTLAGYDAFVDGGRELVKLWGLVRDLGPTSRLRPTGLAVAILNQVMAGNFHRVVHDDPSLTIAAFHSAGQWALAAVSVSPQAREVRVRFPAGATGALPTRLLRLQAAGATAANEKGEHVRVVEETVAPEGSELRFEIPAWGLAVLTSAGLPADAKRPTPFETPPSTRSRGS